MLLSRRGTAEQVAAADGAHGAPRLSFDVVRPEFGMEVAAALEILKALARRKAPGTSTRMKTVRRGDFARLNELK